MADALAYLAREHARIASLFPQIAEARAEDADTDDSSARAAALADDLCAELTIHARLEQEIFYPALRAAGQHLAEIDHAEDEHASVRELIALLEQLYPGDDHFDATVSVLGDEVLRHIAFEERVLFGAARHGGIDLAALGAQLRARREVLDTDLCAPPEAALAQRGARRAPRAPN